MNITLSADSELVERAREYARTHGTSLNQLIRDYLAKISGYETEEETAAAFEETARSLAGRSPEGWRFDRNAIHRNGE